MIVSLSYSFPGITALQLSSAFLRAIKSQGVARFPFIRCMVCGEGRVGKSCLLDTLLDKEFQDLESTRCLHLTRVSCSVDTSGMWVEISEAETTEHVREILVNHGHLVAGQDASFQVSQQQSQLKSEYRSTSAIPTTVSDSLRNPHAADSASPRKEKGQCIFLSVEDAIDLVVLKVSSPEFSATFRDRLQRGFYGVIHCWDLAGQDAYRCIQCMVLPHSRAVFIIVYDASRRIDERAEQATMRVSGTDQSVSRSVNNQSSLEYIMDWLDVAWEGVTGTQSMEPTVYIVGCKADKRLEYGKMELSAQQAVSRLKEELDEDRKALFHCLKGTKYANVIKSENMFLISNKERSHSAAAIERLRRSITENAMTQADIPVGWASFGLALEPLAAVTGKPWISKGEAVQLARRIGCIEVDTDIEKLLEFQHELGYVLYYPKCDDLKNTVVIDVQRVIRIIGTLVQPHLEVSSFPHDDLPDSDDIDLYGKGFITHDLVKRLWRHGADKEFMKEADNQKLAFKLMEFFNIATTFKPSDSHTEACPILLMPSVVSATEDIQPLSSSCLQAQPSISLCCEPPLHFPAFILYQLIVKCLRELISGGDCKLVDLNCVELRKCAARLPWNVDQGMLLTMRYFKESIALQVEAEAEQPDKEAMKTCAREAVAFLEQSLKEVQHVVQCPMKSFRGIRCDCNAATSSCSTSDHMVKLELGGPPICRNTKKVVRRSEAARRAASYWCDWIVVSTKM